MVHVVRVSEIDFKDDSAISKVSKNCDVDAEKTKESLARNPHWSPSEAKLRRLGESELLGVESNKARGQHTDINLEGVKSGILRERSSKPSWVEVVCKSVAFGYNRETTELVEMAQNSVSDSVRNDGLYLGLGRHKTDLVEGVSDMEQEILFGPYETHGGKGLSLKKEKKNTLDNISSKSDEIKFWLGAEGDSTDIGNMFDLPEFRYPSKSTKKNEPKFGSLFKIQDKILSATERRKRDRALKRAKIRGCREEGSKLEGRSISDAKFQARKNTLLLEAEKTPRVRKISWNRNFR
ncbi:hypothetical protein V6N11_008327 [Hibiscus sabdariffa]|uniref:Uncharacterized protein n=1 Tax=Hibiscus sabdariffa TaxID=183260 RepID=A0ABR2Q0C8_9ROSI